jgi:chromosomal replication initiator protein
MELREIQNQWPHFKEALKHEFDEIIWSTHLESLEISAVNDGTVLLTVLSQFSRDFLHGQHLDILSSTWHEFFGTDCTLRIETRSAGDETPEEHPAKEAGEVEAPWRPVSLEKITVPAFSAPRRNSDLQLDHSFTFESYVPDVSSQVAFAAAQAVARNPGTHDTKSYNPLFIYGGIGLGKTHLLQAIGNYIKSHSPETKLIYTTAESFVNAFTDSVRGKTGGTFRKKFRTADVLLIDDIHILKKEMAGSQEELFNTIQALISARNQLVFTCDRPVRELKELNDRLSSRLSMGFNTNLQMPSFETRCAILQKRAKTKGVVIPNDIIELISKNISSNIRDLLAALTTIIGYAELLDEPFSMGMAQNALKQFFTTSKQTNLSPDLIQKIVADHFSVSVKELKDKKRGQTIIRPRHLSMYLIRELTELSLTEIGEYFGRDHSSVSSAIKNISEKRVKDPQEDNTIQELTRIIRENTLK